MKNYLYFILILALFPFSVKAQWLEKEVGNNLFVRLPNKPDYKVTTGYGSYISKTDNCIFMVLVQYGAIKDDTYLEIIKQSEDDQKYVINKFLDGIVQGKLSVVDKSPNATTSINLSKYLGREINYSGINPATGEKGLRFSRVYFILNKVYTFNCFFNKNTPDSYKEKDLFFDSIKYKI